MNNAILQDHQWVNVNKERMGQAINNVTDDDALLCSSCEKPKNELIPTKSKIITNISLYMCNTCIDKGYEPRWVIIMAGRTYGVKPIREYIVKHNYVGEKITADEII